MPFDTYKFYEEQYVREIARKDHLNSAVSVPIGIVGVLVGALTFYLPVARTQFVHHYWVFTWTVAVVALGMTIYYLIRAYYNFRYRLITEASRLRTLQNELHQFHSGADGASAADAELERILVDKYVACATVNTENNDRKSAYLHRATTYLLLAGLATMIGGLPFLTALLEARETEVHRVEIVGCVKTSEKGEQCQKRIR